MHLSFQLSSILILPKYWWETNFLTVFSLNTSLYKNPVWLLDYSINSVAQDWNLVIWSHHSPTCTWHSSQASPHTFFELNIKKSDSSPFHLSKVFILQNPSLHKQSPNNSLPFLTSHNYCLCNYFWRY